MKHPFCRALLILALLVLAFVATSPKASAEAAKAGRPKIYDESLDGSKQIADALVVAKKEDKRVLLQFGANWCIWCHRLHALFRTNAAIVARLNGPVSTSRSDAGIIVTEYGVADLRGAGLAERSRRLLAIAHPDHRERLEREGRNA